MRHGGPREKGVSNKRAAKGTKRLHMNLQELVTEEQAHRKKRRTGMGKDGEMVG